ncbi:MAG: tryptophan 7-halogenase [Alphaproteobacteria bacterium]|nr:MAG: tryptophan 7-halogenase [Alphaproteobacteria bacterium]
MATGEPIREVVIVGGGTAGWMTAAAIARFAGPGRRIRLIESEAIGIVGVGEGTIPPILEFNKQVGLDEQAFIRETRATYKLGIEFVGWSKEGERYFHPFGRIGRTYDGVDFHHLWRKYREHPSVGPLIAYTISAVAGLNGRFSHPSPDIRSPLADLSYAFHFDASLYGQFLRRHAEARGVERVEGRIVDVERDPETGHVRAVRLDDDRRVEGELFVDCSGFRSLLLGQAMGVEFDDWSHWLPCDRAIAVPSERTEPLLPFTRATARPSGWQWRIPLQHRIGNGHVYSSAHMEEEEAERLLVEGLDGKPIGGFNHIRFTAGRRAKSWAGNVIAIGLSSGFLEPLESTSIHLIQHGIQKLVALFPDSSFDPVAVAEYNRSFSEMYDSVRDFIILHYKVNQRSGPFWSQVREMEVPDSLAHKLSLFADRGRFFRYHDDLFELASWTAVMLGQGLIPKSWDPLLDSLKDEEVLRAMADLRAGYHKAASTMETHADIIARIAGAR